MKVFRLRRDALVILTCVLVLPGSASGVRAQPAVEPEPVAVTRSFRELKDRVRSGATIFVTDASGREVRGTLSELSETSLSLMVDGGLREFSESEVSVIKLRQRDSLWNGFLVGVAAGTAPALYWLLADPNECSGSICMEDLMIGVIAGGAIGLAVDAAVQARVIVYRGPPSSSTSAAITVSPIVGEGRKGVALGISFSKTRRK